MASFDPMPVTFYRFFCYIEPFLTICAAIYALFLPHLYLHELLPGLQPAPTSAGVAAVRQLGNCYLLIACISGIFLPTVIARVRDPIELHNLLVRFFAILAFADLTHIASSLVDLRPFRLTMFNTLAHGNTTLVVGLFAFRTAWYLQTSRARRAYEATIKGE